MDGEVAQSEHNDELIRLAQVTGTSYYNTGV